MLRILLSTILVWPLLTACEKSAPSAGSGKTPPANYDKGDDPKASKEEAPKQPALPALLKAEEIPAARAANVAAVKTLAASLGELPDTKDMAAVMATREAFGKIQRENGRICKALKALNDEAGFKAYNQEMNAAGFTEVLRKINALLLPRNIRRPGVPPTAPGAPAAAGGEAQTPETAPAAPETPTAPAPADPAAPAAPAPAPAGDAAPLAPEPAAEPAPAAPVGQ